MRTGVREQLRFAAAAAVLVAATAALADEAPREPSVADLLERIERLEQDKSQMQEEIDELRARVGESGMTERRAEEIRAIVADALADADMRASLLQDGLTAGWDQGFFLGSADGRFRLGVGGMLQSRFVWSFRDARDKYRWGFENTRTRVEFSGHVFGPDLTYLIQGDFSRSGGNDNLLDAWVRYQLNNEVSVRVGQFKLPFSREELISPKRQLAVERSLVNENTNIGRSQGIELTWADDRTRIAFAYSDAGTDNVAGFNFVNTNPQNTPALNADTEIALTGRFERKLAGTWEQFADFTSPVDDPFGLLVGLGVHWQRDEATGAISFGRDEERWLGVTTDVSLELGGASVFGAFTYHYIDDPSFGILDVYGLVLQGSNYFTEKLEAFSRFEWGAVDLQGFDFEDLVLLTFGMNYYFDGHDVKFTADIGFGINQVPVSFDSDLAGYRPQPADSEPQIVIRTQMQLLF